MKDAIESKRAWVVNGVAYLFIVLFIYAAVSKILDFETFRVQLAQSPLLSAYAGIIAWLVPGVEIMIALFLMSSRFRNLALYASFFLMVMFTTYIYIILNFSDFVPCSCGGVLEKMSWTQHLLFNMGFIVLGVFAIVIGSKNLIKGKLLGLLLLTLTGTGLVTTIFSFSEKEMQRNNAFIRRYPPFPLKHLNTYDLKFDSYYIAGVSDGKIYLGNVTAPLYLTILDTALFHSTEQRVEFDEMNLPYRAVRLQIEPPYFYAFDGQVPAILIGNTKDWKASLLKDEKTFYSYAVPIEENVFAIKAIGSKTLENTVGIISFKDSFELKLSYNLLQKQIDGIFDTDGMILWNKELEKIIYLYYYRNEFLIINPDLSLNYQGKTIDTISQVQLDIAIIESKRRSKLGQKSVMVNKASFTSGNYLYVQSDRLGRFEPENILKKATVIDIYNISMRTYVFSIYIYHKKDKKLKSFWVQQDLLLGIMDDQLVTYQLNSKLFNDTIVIDNSNKK